MGNTLLLLGGGRNAALLFLDGEHPVTHFQGRFAFEQVSHYLFTSLKEDLSRAWTQDAPRVFGFSMPKKR